MTVSLRLVPRVVLVLVASIAFIHHLPGQERSRSDNPIIPVIGIVKGISGNVISVDAGERITTVIVDGHTEVWKGKTFHDLSPVQIGDDFSARCRTDASGKLVAEVIWVRLL
jgi:hypothetical protein